VASASPFMGDIAPRPCRGLDHPRRVMRVLLSSPRFDDGRSSRIVTVTADGCSRLNNTDHVLRVVE
jgi:hypothetical protein